MQNEKIFKTKTGFCHILSDKIILTRDGIIGNISKTVVGNGISKILIMLPGSLNDGQNETEKAVEIMKSERILTFKKTSKL